MATSGLQAVAVRHGCKFCLKDNHSSLHCKLYKTHKSRSERCANLGLCKLCLSSKHLDSSCYGKSNKLSFQCSSCKSQSHVTPMCDKLVLSLSPEKISKENETLK